MESTSIPGHIQVTETVAKLLQDRYILEVRGEIEVKGLGKKKTFWLNGKREQLKSLNFL